MERTIRLLQEFIRIPSISGSEGNFAGFLKEILQESGVDRAWIDTVGNVVAVIRGGGLGKVILEGHMDTVDIGDIKQWKVGPFSGKIIDNRLYGRGASDMKGGIASQIGLIERLKELDIDIYAIYTVSEEIAEGIAFREAIKGLMKENLPDIAVTGEATGLDIALGQRGRSVICIDIGGISSHAALPNEGVNALEASSRVISMIKEWGRKFPKHRLLGKETSTPTGISCKPEGLPQLPDRCILTYDHRFLPGKKQEDILAIYKSLCEKAVKDGTCKSCNASVSRITLTTWRGFRVNTEQFFQGWINNDQRLIKNVLRDVRKVYSYASRYYWRFSTDLVYTSGEKGILGMGLGPGRESDAHKPNESVDINEVSKAVSEYEQLIKVINSYLIKPSRSKLNSLKC